ncbi:methyltransferase family protein [Mizugakiibacter sediminis]|uniref:Methyltransferase family protein n=1 Tax=Mizugakiibacter sediminis TaxID=1475481 RepID=A0A0K8QJZ2_9GAMM|nr:class I SAM-dependent methyltransferase [Mizugakiibacter sediminis]GAP65026.1 methyltransferase family protein [Mizugakiibacter sediminis]
MKVGCGTEIMVHVRDEWLEQVKTCPVCNSHERSLLATGLTDLNYRVVGGRWSFVRCNECRTGYLTPRIDARHIGLAYGRYETHEPPANRARARGLRGLLQRARDAYLARRYGLDTNERSQLLALLMYLLPPPLRQEWDFQMRHATAGSGCSVLDVGCGNGDFLQRMRRAGWTVRGIDSDAQAVAVARAQGVDVMLGSLQDDSHASNLYDLVTASHVIEHVHDPAAFIAQLYDRVAPGGKLWICTPNVDSPVRAFEGRWWDKWEVPRHLYLFSKASLRQLIESTLGRTTRFRRRGWHIQWAIAQSERLRAHGVREGKPALRWWHVLLAGALECAAWVDPRFGDELVVEVHKPAGQDVQP